MDLKDIINERYSVRDYLPQKVEESKIKYILECAQLAPSACNLQPWYFYVIESEELRSKVCEAYNREWFKKAPVYIVVCKDTVQSWKRASDGMDSGDIDAAIAAQHICLAVHDAGLGTCWVCNFDLPSLTKSLDIPQNREAIAIFPIGYVDKEKSKILERKRKPINEISEWR
ncbi:nitroreductase [Dysgonomonas sp. PH5-45]|uniref:nitroreductase family protein n=1 Tax=unclassified Dysgonomonas TaxID=2630389 RepID=UPI002476B052|nr:MULTISPECIES: nitroreductase family protein [unclassified Dysgonomonas]MDH6353908.1 nitroreductase [Dysgonomonas sp. PH5-45]MDH6386810.1 nitroreductase [Dysgonomonas sp. PH5-37]